MSLYFAQDTTGEQAYSDTQAIASTHIQAVKLIYGDSGTATFVSSTNVLPVHDTGFTGSARDTSFTTLNTTVTGVAKDTSFSRTGGVLVDLGANNDVTVTGTVTMQEISNPNDTDGVASTYRNTALVAQDTSVSTSAVLLKGYYIGNPDTVGVYMHFYNASDTAVTVGTTTPKFSYYIPAQGAANRTLPEPGIQFSTALAVAATTTVGGDSDAGPSTGLVVNLEYE